jgi:hypothetical protein
VSVHVRLPGSQFDALERQAVQERLGGVPELIRRRLVGSSRADDDDDD